jgi:hypothetical protein
VFIQDQESKKLETVAPVCICILASWALDFFSQGISCSKWGCKTSAIGPLCGPGPRDMFLSAGHVSPRPSPASGGPM